MNSKILAREDEKYSYLWGNGYKEARWEVLAEKVLGVAGQYSGSPKILDLGFGNGQAMDFFEQNGLYVAGVDISSYTCEQQRQKGRTVFQSSLDDLSMFDDGSFQIGFSNDVLEHLPEDCVQPALEEMARVCSDYLFICVCPAPSHGRSREGENLHLTIHGDSWWRERLEEVGTVHRYKLWFRRSMRYMVDLQHQ